MALPKDYGQKPTKAELERVYTLICRALLLQGRAPSYRVLAKQASMSLAHLAASVNVLIYQGRLVRGKQKAASALGLPQSRTLHAKPSLDQQAMELLSSTPNTTLVWLQNKTQTGYYGFEVWTPELGHVVTVLEI